MGEHLHDATSTLFEFVEARLKQIAPAPPLPADPQKVRETAGYTAQEFADIIGVSDSTLRNWEQGKRSQGQQWRRYCWTLYWFCHHPIPSCQPSPSTPPAPAQTPPPAARAAAAPLPRFSPPVPQQRTRNALAPASAAKPPSPLPAPVTGAGAGASAGRPGTLAVLSADHGALHAHLSDGRTIPCPVTTLEQLPHWAAGARFSPWQPPRGRAQGRVDSPEPPLLALTPSAAALLGLPPTNQGADRSAAEHLLKQAGWHPSDSPLTAWPLLRPSTASKARLIVLPWTAPGNPFQLADPADTARLMGRYTSLVMPPSGSPGHCGVRLMSLLRPELDALTGPDPVPRPSVELPAVWWRAPHKSELKSHRVVIALRVVLPLVSAASRLNQATGPLEHHRFPPFASETMGMWRVDLSDYPHDPRLPVPFTADGRPPAGPQWYPTDAVTFAATQGCRPEPIEAWLCPHKGRALLNPWYERLRDAHLAVLERLAVDPDTSRDPRDVLADIEDLPRRGDAVDLALLDAIAATEEQAVLAPPAGQDPPWLPLVRDTLLTRARTVRHRKLCFTAEATKLCPLAVTPHWLVYSAPDPDVFRITAPRNPGQGVGLRLGVRPGSVQPAGHARLDDYADLVTALDPGDPSALQLLQGLIPARPAA